jgi:enoyl-CoA hydratase/carnithine racemase
VIKGAGGNFSSGNDLKNFMNPVLTDLNTYFVTVAMSNMVVQLT